jgi:hypothetical protein
MRFGPDDLGGGMAMVKERIVVGEALCGEELLRIESAVGLPELGMALVRYAAKPMVVWHGGCFCLDGCRLRRNAGGRTQGESSRVVRRKTYFHFLLSIQ